MQEFSFHIDIDKPFSNLKIKDHVLLVLLTADQKLIVSRKHSYPTNIWRLLGGKPDKRESLAETAKRELAEESGLKLPHSRIKHIAAIHGQATDYEQNDYELITHLYLVKLTKNEIPQAQDDVDEITALSFKQFEALIKAYQALSPNSWIYKNGYKKFSWYDYGQYYSRVHQIALDLVTIANGELPGVN